MFLLLFLVGLFVEIFLGRLTERVRPHEHTRASAGGVGRVCVRVGGGGGHTWRPRCPHSAGRSSEPSSCSLFTPAGPALAPTLAPVGSGGCVLRLQSYWVVRIHLDTFKKSKRQIAPLIPKCLLPSAATCSRWDLHNE